jgi:hypothetical protein
MGCQWYVVLSDGTEFCVDLPPDLGLAIAMLEIAFFPLEVQVIVNTEVMIR